MSAGNEQVPSSKGSPSRDIQIRAVIDECCCRRRAGEIVSDDALIADHPDLMPELGEELRKLRLIAAARQQAARPIDSGVITYSQHDSDTGRMSGRLEVRCPNCHEPSVIAVDTTLTDLTCNACGSHFSLVDRSKASRMAPSLTKLGRFELIERLGVGGFGSVWKARDKELDRTVAIKVPRAGAMTAEEQEKFFREARAAAQLRHPNIVSVHEVGRDGDSVYIVSDFVRGVTLGDWLTGQQLTSREAVELCAKIADALHHAHDQGVVHRDLKPDNILIDGDGQPHLTDFGLARREKGEVTVTMDGQVLGTPAYMSPEQARGEAHTADRRSDVYSLGVTLFQLLTGELPFRGNARMIMHQVIHDEAPSPRRLNGTIPRDLETITLKCLEKEPDRRYQTAQEVAAEFRRWMSGDSILARPVNRLVKSWRWTKRNPRLAALTTTVVILLATVAVISTIGKIAAQKAASRESVLVQQARQTVDDFFTEVSQSALLDTSRLQPLRKRLLELALQYYRDFATQRPGDPEAAKDLAAASFRVGVIDAEMGAHVEASEYINQATQIWERLREGGLDESDLNANLATAYFNLASLGSESDVKAPGIDLCNKSRAIWEELLKQNPADADYRLSLARTLDQIAVLQQRDNQLEQALQTYADADKQYRTAIERSPTETIVRRQLAVHLNAVALVYMRLGNYDRARENLLEAVKILEECVRTNPTSLSSQRYLATTYYQLGKLTFTLNELSDARKFLQRAETIQQSIAEQNPSVPSIQLEYAETLVKTTQVQSPQMVVGEQSASAARAKQILLQLASTSQQESGVRRSLPALFLDLASTLEFVGDQNVTTELRRDGLQIVEQLLRDCPSDQELIRVQVRACLGLAKSAAARRQNSDSLMWIQQARRCWETLPASNGQDRDSQMERGTLLAELARLEVVTGHRDDAISSHTKAVEVLRSFGPANNQVQILTLIGELQEQFADVLRNSGELDAAESHYRDALRIGVSQNGLKSPIVAAILGKQVLVQAAAGRNSAYRASCRELLQNFGNADDPELVNLIAWACSLRPEGARDPSQIVTLAEKALAAAPEKRSYLYTSGAVLYRAGKLDRSLAIFQKAIAVSDTDFDAADNLFISMIYFTIGRIDDARTLLRMVEKDLDAQSPDLSAASNFAPDARNIENVIECRVILAEAKQMIESTAEGKPTVVE